MTTGACGMKKVCNDSRFFIFSIREVLLTPEFLNMVSADSVFDLDLVIVTAQLLLPPPPPVRCRESLKCSYQRFRGKAESEFRSPLLPMCMALARICSESIAKYIRGYPG